MPPVQNGDLRNMELTRRSFQKLSISALIALAIGGWKAGITLFQRNAKPRIFPGTVHPLNHSRIKEQGKWKIKFCIGEPKLTREKNPGKINATKQNNRNARKELFWR